MMKLLAGVLMLGMLAACSSSPTKEQEGAAVEDRSQPVPGDPSAGKPKPGTGVTTKPQHLLRLRSVCHQG
jgi:uncharacterized lipoprotein